MFLKNLEISWDAILNMIIVDFELIAIVDLELITHPVVYIFFEKSMRGGVSYISNRYSKANNMYLKFYNPKQESKHIIYLDMSNLCAYAMS